MIGMLSPLPGRADVRWDDHFLGGSTARRGHQVVEGGKGLHGQRLLHVGVIEVREVKRLLVQLPLLGLQGSGRLLDHIIPLLVVLEEGLATQVLRWGPAM